MDLGPLLQAIDDLVAAGPESLSDPDSLVALYRCRSQIEALCCESASHAERTGVHAADGARSAATWLATRARQPEQVARRDLRHGRAMQRLRKVAEAFRRGEIASSHLALFSRLCGSRSDDSLQSNEQLLLDKARELRFDQFQRCMQYFEQLADPDGTEEAAEERRSRRDVSLSRSIGGMWFGRMTLDEVAGEIVSNELDRLEEVLFESDRREATARLGRLAKSHELARTASQRRADALVEMARRSGVCPDGAGRPAPLFTVFVGYETLKGRILELASGAVVAPGSLIAYLDEAILERAVFGPRQRAEIGARQRLFSGATRRAIECRDRECVHPYCSVRVDRCQVNHRIPYEAGGLTTQEGGELTCPFHNRTEYSTWCALPDETKQRLIAEQLEEYLSTLDPAVRRRFEAVQSAEDPGRPPPEACKADAGEDDEWRDDEEVVLSDGYRVDLAERGPPAGGHVVASYG